MLYQRREHRELKCNGGEVWVSQYHVVFLLYMPAVQVYSNNSEVATLYPNQTSFTFTGLTPGTLYLMSVGAFTDAGEGEREERIVQTDGAIVRGTNYSAVCTNKAYFTSLFLSLSLSLSLIVSQF